MATNYFKAKKGISIEPTATSVSAKGDIGYNSSTDKFEGYNGAVDPLVQEAKTQTLTNKTLSGNTATNLISGSGILTLNTSGTITVPNGTDTLVGKATTDTLTNKTLTSPTINAGALSGTFSGDHTLSGALTLSSSGTALTITNNARVSGTLGVGGAASSTVGVGVTGPATADTATLIGLRVDNSPTATTNGSYSWYGIYQGGNATIKVPTGVTNSANYIGMRASALRQAASGDDGSLAGSYAYYGQYGNAGTGSGITTSAYGMYLRGYYQNGTVTNMYGIYLDSPSTGGTLTNTAWGIYQASSDAQNYFGGKVGIGMTPGRTLDVTGAAGVTGQTTLGTSATNSAAYAVIVQGNTTTGSSFGLSTRAGTNGSDYSFLANDASNTVNLFRVHGDGNILTKNNTLDDGSGNATLLNGTIGTSSSNSGTNALSVQGNTTTGSSDGVLIQAGTNTSDWGLRVRNAGATATNFSVRGDGAVQTHSNVLDDGSGNSTFNASMTVSADIKLGGSSSANTGVTNIDGTGISSKSIAGTGGGTTGGGTATFTTVNNKDGIAMVKNSSTGNFALIAIYGGGGSISIISDPASKFSTSAGTASKDNITISAGVLTIEHNSSTSTAQSFRVLFINI